MIQIGDTIVSFDVFEKHFLCDLAACKGACCVEGESGAPLTKVEAKLIKKYYPVFEHYMTNECKKIVESKGFSVVDSEGDLVTPLFDSRECVYTFVDELGITKCAIEKAFLEGKIDFRKPVSCHLFPIRITKYKTFSAVNYQRIDICNAARLCGQQNKLPLYVFLKDALIRKYGTEWYNELEIAAEHVKGITR